jgi:hypothetical protein
MPAKTVKDLIEFNNSVPDEFKVKIKLEFIRRYSGHSSIKASYCTYDGGIPIDFDSEVRGEYYDETEKGWWKKYGTEKESSHAMTRYNEPKKEGKLLYPWGSASCKENRKKEDYPCHNAWFTAMTDTAKGYGPMLYDCLIVKLGELGFGLTADRSLVSELAANVWLNYYNNRSDVIKKPLDIDRSSDDTEDDCYQEHQHDTGWNTWMLDPSEKKFGDDKKGFEDTKKKREVMRKAVNFAYFDNGIKTLDELRKADLIYSESGFVKEYLESLYRSLLKP